MIELSLMKNKFENMEYIKYPYEDLDYDLDIIKDKSEEYVQKPIRVIDGSSYDGSDFISKFTGTTFSIQDASDGAKTAIYIGYCVKNNCWHDKAIDITSCGANAIEFIFREYGDKQLKLVLRHTDLPMNVDVAFRVNGQLFYNTSKLLDFLYSL